MLQQVTIGYFGLQRVIAGYHMIQNIDDLERCQRNAIRLIDNQYETYEIFLINLKLPTLLE